MSGAAYILLINLCVAGLFCAAFVFLSTRDGAGPAPRWFAAAYALGMLNFVFEATVPAALYPGSAVVLANAAFIVALTAINVGLCRRYGVAVPTLLFVAVMLGSVALHVAILEMPRQSVARLVLYQLPFVALQGLGAAILLRARVRDWPDRLLVAVLALNALHFLAKPVLALAVGGVGDDAAGYLDTAYALLSQSAGTVLAIATALLLIALTIADMLRDVTRRSETDALSGLLNRRGFELRLEECLAAPGAVPVTLVICDLDRFKSVNDTFGHAVGDRLIAAFAETLQRCASPHHMLARIGGEEFAAILPGSHLAAGRLFAEAARSAFATLRLEGFEDETFTGSFGVAEHLRGELPSAFMARADGALYAAKRAGRDCVRVWGEGLALVEPVRTDDTANVERRFRSR